jgi:hypothetical protein
MSDEVKAVNKGGRPKTLTEPSKVMAFRVRPELMMLIGLEMKRTGKTATEVIVERLERSMVTEPPELVAYRVNQLRDEAVAAGIDVRWLPH